MFNMYLNEQLFENLQDLGLKIDEVCNDFYKEIIWIEEIYRYPTAKELAKDDEDEVDDFRLTPTTKILKNTKVYVKDRNWIPKDDEFHHYFKTISTGMILNYLQEKLSDYELVINFKNYGHNMLYAEISFKNETKVYESPKDQLPSCLLIDQLYDFLHWLLEEKIV